MTEPFPRLGNSCRWALVTLIAGAMTANAQLPKWTVVRDLLLDGAREEFVDIGTLRTMSDGSIYVQQTSNGRTVRAYSADGKRLWTFGREGSGPGEFKTMNGQGMIGDSLWVFDWSQRPNRITVITPTGRLGRVFPVTPLSGRQSGVRLVGDGLDGLTRGLYADGLLLREQFNRGADSAAEFVRVAPSAVKPVVVARRTPGPPGSVVRVPADRPMGSLPMWDLGRLPLRFFPMASTDISDHALMLAFADAPVTGDAAGFAFVTVITHTGDTVYSKRVPATQMMIPPGVVDDAFDAAIAAEKRPHVAAAMKKVERPKIWPPLQGVRVADNGSTLLLFNTDGPLRDALVLDPTGRPLALLEIPSDVIVTRYYEHSILGKLRNADDVESIVRYRIERR